jgi:hypothetical protein
MQGAGSGAGSGYVSGSISQRYGSPDPDPHHMSRIGNTAHYLLRILCRSISNFPWMRFRINLMDPTFHFLRIRKKWIFLFWLRSKLKLFNCWFRKTDKLSNTIFVLSNSLPVLWSRASKSRSRNSYIRLRLLGGTLNSAPAPKNDVCVFSFSCLHARYIKG